MGGCYEKGYILVRVCFLILWIFLNESCDCKIHTTYSVSSPNSRRTELIVVVCNPIVNRQKIYTITKEFTDMSGWPDTLTLAIYWMDIDTGREI